MPITICGSCPCFRKGAYKSMLCGNGAIVRENQEYNRKTRAYFKKIESLDKWIHYSENCELKSVNYGDKVFTPERREVVK